MKPTLLFRLVTIVLAAAALASFAVGCSPKPNAPAPQAPAVTVAAVQRQELVEWDEFTGRTEAMESVEVRPRVSGHVQEVRFQAGQLVRKGDVLFVIDRRWHQAELDRRQAEFEQARVRAENAERESKRTEQLLANRAISVEEAEARAARFNEAKAALLAARAARDTAQLDLDYTLVRAPIDGRISRERVTPGNYASGVPAAATLLTTIVSVDPIFVYADVDEHSLLKFQAAARSDDACVPVELQLTGEDGFPRRGYIESFDNRLDPQTGSILLRAVFPNPDGRIVPGLFARVRVPLTDPHPALLVDEEAIGTDQARKFVFALTSTNTVEYRPVTLGPSFEGKRIVRDGVRAGERIVVNGLQRIRPGMPVTPQTAVANSGPLNVARR